MTLKSLPEPLRPGQSIFFGRYRLVRLLGRGGMGDVWQVEDIELGRPCALKFIIGVYDDDTVAVQKLRREVVSTQLLTHQHIVRVFDLVRDAQLAAIAMEWIDGATLKELLGCQPASRFHALEISDWVEQCCHAMAYAHAHDVVHLDLKPSNLMVNRCGQLKVTDFGIAQSLRHPMVRFTGMATGTPAYMSPQRRALQPHRRQDDVFAFGATLYSLVTGRTPNGTPVFDAQETQQIPLNWRQTIGACMGTDPDDRPRGFVEVAMRLGFEVAAFRHEVTVPTIDPRVMRAQSQLMRLPGLPQHGE